MQKNQLKTSRFFLGLLLSWALWMISYSAFPVPLELSYGARLADANGRPIEGPINLRIEFIDGKDGVVSNVTLDDFTAVPLIDGAFQVKISLSAADFQRLTSTNRELWIRITDLTHTTTYPAQKFATAAFAVKIPVDGKTISYNSKGQLSIRQLEHLNLQAADASKRLRILSSTAQTSKLEWTLPATAGNQGEYLTSAPDGTLSWGTPTGTGDMLKSTYDRDDSGYFDRAKNATLLDGKTKDFYLQIKNAKSGITQHIFTKAEEDKIPALAQATMTGSGGKKSLPWEVFLENQYVKVEEKAVAHSTKEPDWTSICAEGNSFRDNDIMWKVGEAISDTAVVPTARRGAGSLNSWVAKKYYIVGDTIKGKTGLCDKLLRVVATNAAKCQSKNKLIKAYSGEFEPFWPAVGKTVLDGGLEWTVKTRPAAGATELPSKAWNKRVYKTFCD